MFGQTVFAIPSRDLPGNPKAFDKVSLMKFIKRVNVERSTRASGTVQGVMH